MLGIINSDAIMMEMQYFAELLVLHCNFGGAHPSASKTQTVSLLIGIHSRQLFGECSREFLSFEFEAVGDKTCVRRPRRGSQMYLLRHLASIQFLLLSVRLDVL